MITTILLSCFTIIVSGVPVSRHAISPLLSQGGAEGVQPVYATNQKLEAQTLSPSVEQPQQQNPQSGPQYLPPLQHYTWFPLGGDLRIVPRQPSVLGSEPANQATLQQQQQPLVGHPVFPFDGHFPVFSSAYKNQLFSPYGFPLIPLPQAPANQPPNARVSLGETPQPTQQQENAQIVYMLQKPVTSPLGSLSSEELEVASELGRLGVYMPRVFSNPPAGGVQPASQAAGTGNPGHTDAPPSVGTSSPGVQQTQGLHQTSTSMPKDVVAVGLGGPVQATVQTPAQPELQPTQGNAP